MDKVTWAIIIGAVAFAVVVGGYFILKGGYQAPTPAPTGPPAPEKVAPEEQIPSPPEEVSLPDKEEAIAPAPTEEQMITPEPTPEPISEPVPEPVPEPTPKETAPTAVSHTVEADDNGLYPSTITVPAGATVNLTFKVRSTNVYFGGLDFRSSKFSTGKVPPGGETTVSFTTTDSFQYSSYWPSSGTKKADGMITVSI